MAAVALQRKGLCMISNLLLHKRGESGIFTSHLPQGRGQISQNPFSQS